MMWGYVGDGCWELQHGNLLIGCIYGNKNNDRCRLTVEKILRDAEGVARPVGPEVLWSSERTEMELDEAKMLVEAHMERLLRLELSFLQHVY
jgi:hypothetical protein